MDTISIYIKINLRLKPQTRLHLHKLLITTISFTTFTKGKDLAGGGKYVVHRTSLNIEFPSALSTESSRSQECGGK